MAFVDLVSLTIMSGKGGAGASSFRREKFVPKGGPDGGNGGKGGNIIFRANTNLQTLMDLKIRKVIKAQNGLPGLPKKQFGKDGEDMVIEIPCGTLIKLKDGELLSDLTKHGMTYTAAEGGKGGRGNACFSSSTHQTPTYAQPGLPGEEKEIELELQLLAEVGIIGLPNAGKSTLLNALTSANPKIGNYPFTTLFPNLGMLKFEDREIVLADIPGLIEGAASGVGLGHEFLRHISRTELLIHLVEIPLEDSESAVSAFEKVNAELAAYSENLAQKQQILVLSKADLFPPEQFKEVKKMFQHIDKTIHIISAHSRQGLEDLKKLIIKALPEKKSD